ncbi:MAG: TraB/GumN family protein [Saprospiraceae bacterium]
MSKDSLLWKISHPDRIQESYLFGTMHIMYGSNRERFAEIIPYLSKCEILLLETEMGDTGGMTMSDLIFENGLTLEEFLTRPQYKRIKKFLAKSFHLDLDQLKHLKPMAIHQMIQQMEFAGNKVFYPEKFLEENASRLSIPLKGLETSDFQFELLKDTSIAIQIKSLRGMMKNPSEQKKHFRKMIQTYQDQKLARLHQMLKRQSGGIRKTYLYERNFKMGENLSHFLKEGPVFCAIGAGHLWGGKGILRILKKKGFRLSPISIWKES